MKNVFPNLRPKLKNALVAVVILHMGTVAMANLETSADVILANPISSLSKPVPRISAGSVIALNRSLNMNGVSLPMGSELIVGVDGQLSLVQSNKNSIDGDDIIETGTSINDLSNMDFTLLKQNAKTGEIEDYNLPSDFQVAGPGANRGKHHGVTNCYHVVKALVHRRITLTGIAAYMAAPQLQAAGWHRYANYDAAPRGSVCVFAAGGIPTTSGGQRYGHVGVKGAGGIANPLSGFHLKRPFLGCWNER